MGSRVGLEMLAVLLLLTPIVSDCLVIPKCQLVEQLMSTVPEDVPDHEKLVAEIVCHVEMTSHFDTSVINEVAPQDLPGRSKTRGAPKTTRPPKTTTVAPTLQNSTQELNFNGTYSHVKRGADDLWRLYGVFQLSDHVACTSSQKLSFNLCNLSCKKLTDDDITDDINCVLTILNSKKTNPNGPSANSLIRTMRDMLMNTCPNLDYTQYLAECAAT